MIPPSVPSKSSVVSQSVVVSLPGWHKNKVVDAEIRPQAMEIVAAADQFRLRIGHDEGVDGGP